MLTISACIDVARRARPAARLTEATPSRYGGRTQAPVVVWNLTKRCNQRCAHCYASAEAVRSPRELDPAASRRILHELAEHGVPAVIFSGGEPLLREDLPELVQLASDLGVRPQLSSNGTLATKPKLRFLKSAGLGYFGVSIDGDAAFNDRFRGMPRGWERAMRGLLAGRDVGLKTGLRMTVTAENSEHVPRMLDLAEEVGASRFYVSHLVEVGRGITVDALVPARTRGLLYELFDLALAARERGSKVDVVTGGNDSAGPLFLKWVGERLGPDAVLAVELLLASRGGNRSAVGILCIDDEGVVHPDQFWRSEVLADLKTQPFSAALEHPLRALLSSRHKYLEGRCGDCRFLRLCAGGHRERAIARGRGLWAPDPSCVMRDDEVLNTDPVEMRRKVAGAS